ncbi:MAG: septal ring lytic transglycosylase RlpA family protein [Candidatus Binatia bacterium]
MRWGVVAGLGVLALAVGGCGLFSKEPPRIEPATGATQTGIASWYGPGFHGKRTANGEVYDQNGLTAAHRTLPHGTMVEVTNLTNERVVRVRINDRGPYIDDRVIDLSRGAAQRIGLIAPGIAPVRIQVLPSDADVEPVLIAAGPAPAARPEPARASAAPPPPAPAHAAPSAPTPPDSARTPPAAVAAAQPAPAPLVAARPAAPAVHSAETPRRETVYAVHVGTYADYERARREQLRLGSQVGRVQLGMIDAPDARYYQLRIGPFAQPAEAARMVQRLVALGMPALVVTSAAGR